MRLLVMRHGESEADLLDVHEGRADFELTEKGREQAAKLADFLSAYYRVDCIYASPLRRAMQTAEYIGRKTGVDICVSEHLMEFNNGLLAGMSREEARMRYPKRPLSIHQSAYEQESQLAFRFRAEHMLSEILCHPLSEGTIAVVSHGGMINQLYRAFLRLPVDSDVYLMSGDTALHEWEVRGDRRIIVRTNSTVHLQEMHKPLF